MITKSIEVSKSYGRALTTGWSGTTMRGNQEKRCQGRTPMETFRENIALLKEKIWAMMKEDRLVVVT